MYFYKFPYALILFDKDTSEYSTATAPCGEQLAQLFCVYTGYMGSRITWSIYNFGKYNFFCIEVLFIADKKFTITYQPDMNVERFLKTCMFIPRERVAHLLAFFLYFKMKYPCE